MAASHEGNVLSDVHLSSAGSESLEKRCGCSMKRKWLSRFYFWLPQSLCATHMTAVSTTVISDPIYNHLGRDHVVDDDGDFIVLRQSKAKDMKLIQAVGMSDDDLQLCVSCGHDYSSQIDSSVTNSVSIHASGNCESESVKYGNSENQSITQLGSEYLDLTEGSCKSDNILLQQQAAGSAGPELLQSKENCENDYSSILDMGQSQQKISHCKDKHVHGVLTIEHRMETPLSEVGFQVWRGALLLCDYLVHCHTSMEGTVTLDLGAGTGITSLVAAMFAPQVLCTDYSADIVGIAEQNWLRNKDLLPQRKCDVMTFKILDWKSDLGLPCADEADHSKYSLTPVDLQHIEKSTIILAAEVIYDEELTDAFFQTIYHLLSKPPVKTVLMTLERRVVFSTESQDVCSPAYEHFLENVADLTTVDEGPVRFGAVRISASFPQYFQYQRVKELELWKISSHFPAFT